jgi:hypothetical protein
MSTVNWADGTSQDQWSSEMFVAEAAGVACTLIPLVLNCCAKHLQLNMHVQGLAVAEV